MVCSICDVYCQVRAKSDGTRVTQILPHANRALAKNICMKAVATPKIANHRDRLLHPLKRVGERGENRWELISWDQAMDEIAERLRTVVDSHGPEGFATAASPWNTTVDGGMGRRFINLLGSPNWTSGVSICMGNTAAVNKVTYGWFPSPDILTSKCIVLFGHSPSQHSWTAVYNAGRFAQGKGAKLIVVDPRVSNQAEVADLHLRLRSGTDAAMMLGRLDVIISERLYDADFVENWTIGFDQLRARVAEYPLERVADITGVEPDLIARAARMYATSGPAILPWSPITDQQVSSTCTIRLQGILRAICGNLRPPRRRDPRRVQPRLHPRIPPRASRGALPGAAGRTTRCRPLSCAHLPGRRRDRSPRRADLGLSVLQYRGRLPHGHPLRPVPGHGHRRPVPDQGVLQHRQQHPLELFQSPAHPPGASQPGAAGRLRLVPHPHSPARRLRVARRTFLERPAVADSWSWSTRLQVFNQITQPPGDCRSLFERRRCGGQEHEDPLARVRAVLALSGRIA